MAGIWNNTSSNTLPGLYIRFVDAAKKNVQQLDRTGTIAIPVVNYAGGTAVAEKFYEVKDVATAETLFGAANVQAIKLALNHGAEKVLAYTVPAIGTAPAPTTEKEQYDLVRAAFDTRPFDGFVYDVEVSASEQDECIKWIDKSRSEGKHFIVVFGQPDGTSEDANITLGNARSTRLANEYAVNLVTPVIVGGASLSSAQYAPAIVAEICATALNKSVTFKQLADVEDIGLYLSVQQKKDALASGSLVISYTGSYARIEQGIVTKSKDEDNNPKVYKIRKTRVRQTVSNELAKLVEEQIIGKINNDEDGYAFAVSMVKLYLEQLEQASVLEDITVKLDPENPPVGDALFIMVDFVELDSVERVFLTITA